jgi:uncharacterized damage-inducible protein DinB
MFVDLSLNDLLDYTDWERHKWHAWFRQHGASPLKISAGPHGDGRFTAVGELVRHIFSAEKRYVERLSGRSLTDPASIRADDVDALFQFGQQSRSSLREFITTFPARDWDVPRDFTILNNFLRATPRKIVIHILMHEIRHWAQIATLLRLHGLTDEFHDLLFSPVLGGEYRREQGKQ